MNRFYYYQFLLILIIYNLSSYPGISNDIHNKSSHYAVKSLLSPTISNPVYSSVTDSSVSLGAEITSDGGFAILESGVVWALHNNPNISDSKNSTQIPGTGSFALTVNGLPAFTTIYFRGFATNSNGTSYTTVESFTTLPSSPSVTGNFSCGPGSTVLSALGKPTGGNYLWYDAATGGNLLQDSIVNTFNTPTISSTTTFYVTAAKDGVESAPRVPVTATFIPPVTAEIIEGVTINRCLKDSVELNAVFDSTCNNCSYKWEIYSTDSGGSYIPAPGNNIGLSYKTSKLGFYRVVVTKGDCNWYSSATEVLDQNPPTSSIQEGTFAFFCQGENLTLNALTDIGDIFQWQYSSDNNVYNDILGATLQNYTTNNPGYYKVLITKDACNSLSQSINVVEYKAPTAAIDTGLNAYFCENDSKILSAETDIGNVFQWTFAEDGINFSNVSNDLSSQQNTLTVSREGYYKVEISNDLCTFPPNSSDAVFISEKKLDSLFKNEGDTVELCEQENTTISISYSNPDNIQWLYAEAKDSTYLPVPGDGNQASYTTNLPGFYKASVTVGECSILSQSILIKNVDKIPPLIDQGDPISFCINDTATLSTQYDPDYTYQWKYFSFLDGMTFINAPGNSNQATYKTNVPGFYSVEVVRNNCVTAVSAPSEVIMNTEYPTSEINEGELTMLCEGSSIMLSTAKINDYQYQWYFSLEEENNYSPISNLDEGNDVVTIYQTGFYKLLTNNGGCEEISDPIQVKSKNAPEAIIENPDSLNLCQGESATLTAKLVDGYTYQWQFSTTDSLYENEVNAGNSTSKYETSKEGFYRVITTLDGCADTSSIVHLNVLTLDSSKIEQNTLVSICDGDSTLLSVELKENGKYQWYYSDVDTLNMDLLVETTNELMVKKSGFYQAKIGNGVCNDINSNIIFVEILPTPNPVIEQGDSITFCEDNPVSLSTSLKDTYSYQWEFSGTQDSIFTAISGAQFNSLQTSQEGYYRVVVEENNGCSRVSNVITVIKELNPIVYIENVSDSPFCGSGTLYAKTNIKGDITYQWKKNGENIGENTNSIIVSENGNYSVSIVNNSCGMFNSQEEAIAIYELPTASITSSDTIFCISGRISALEISDANYRWLKNGSYLSETGHELTVDDPGFYQVEVETQCKALSDSIFIGINKDILANLEIENDLCNGGKLTINSNDSLPVLYKLGEEGEFQTEKVFENISAGIYNLYAISQAGCEERKAIEILDLEKIKVDAGNDVTMKKGTGIKLAASNATSYSWTPTIGLSNPNIPDPIAIPEETITYTVTGVDQNGCISQDDITVTVTDHNDLIISKLVSPNGDGINDFWEIYNSERYPSLVVNIFNRNGVEIYKTDNYQNQWNGNGQPSGAYYYIISVNEKTLTGSFNLIK
ncbi:gliding motility-associated C-terminal domain-containing protein [Flexithrix dorotheae]|uniref:gliding motility-associated C-terminal domain-containing protein n=1 Tax=Flexithrix dorotheae TaxID=70993 RepID=UPI0003654FC2|nr:T9SS C-terminal target domain-containing protein [Flexithrix dorotheae]